MPLALGIDEFDRRLALAGEKAVDHAAVFGGDGVGAVVALDGTVRVEDVNQQLLRRMDRHARQLRADLAAFAGVHVALAAVLLEHRLAASGVAAGEHDGKHLVDHLLAVRIRQATPGGDQLFRPLAELLVREFSEPISLHERKVGEPDRSLLEPFNEHRRPGLVVDGRPVGRLADSGRERARLVENRLGGALRV